MMDERMITNIEKLVVYAIKSEGGAFFKNSKVFLGAIDILNGPNRTISKKDSAKYVHMHDEVQVMIDKEYPKSLSEESREEYCIKKEVTSFGSEYYMPLRKFAEMVFYKELEFAE